MAFLLVPSRTPGSTWPKPGRLTLLATPITQAFRLKTCVFGSNGKHEGIRPLSSPLYIVHAMPNCRMLFRHAIFCAFALAEESAGNSNAARMAMMAMTTSSSIKVKPCLLLTSQSDVGALQNVSFFRRNGFFHRFGNFLGNNNGRRMRGKNSAVHFVPGVNHVHIPDHRHRRCWDSTRDGFYSHRPRCFASPPDRS